MSLKRYVAASAREAMSAVRRELGEDAVVLANRRVREGVEITAMASGEIDAVVELATPSTKSSQAAAKAAARAEPFESFVRRTARATGTDSTAIFLRDRAERSAAREAQSAQAEVTATPVAKAVAAPLLASVTQPVATTSIATAQPISAAAIAMTPLPANAMTPPTATHSVASLPGAGTPDDSRLLAEIHAMKASLADQIAAFAWFDAARKHPLQARLVGEMLGAGFSPALARELLEKLPTGVTDDQARRWMVAALTRNLASFGEGNFMDAGGVFALVGPTGVGKTTTTAKLAARYAMRYGSKNVGLVTTDGYRIGAHDQLKIYGRILGIPVQLARGGTLASLIESMRDKKIVLIDTVGVGQRDPRVPELMAELEAAGAKKVLLLNAVSQGETLDEVIGIYRRFRMDGAIVTKIDEAARIGGALDGAIRHRLALAFITNGQRVPEDLHPAQSAFLIQRALRAAASPAFQLKDEEHGILFAHAARVAREAKAHAHAA